MASPTVVSGGEGGGGEGLGPGAGIRAEGAARPPSPSSAMPADDDSADTGQRELQQLLEQAFRKGVADGKKRELRRVFGQFGFNAPTDKSRLRDMRSLFDDNVKYFMQESANSRTINDASKYGSGPKGEAGPGGPGAGELSYRGGTYDSRGQARRRSPPPPSYGYGSREEYGSKGQYGSRGQYPPEGAPYGSGPGYGSGTPGADGEAGAGYGIRGEGRSDEKQVSIHEGYSGGEYGDVDPQQSGGQYREGEDDVRRVGEGVTMPKDLTRGGDIKLAKHFNVGGYGGKQVYDSHRNVVGTRGQYDTRGRKKPDKTHVSLGLNFKVHLSPKDGKMLSKVVGDKKKNKKDKKDNKGKKRKGKKGRKSGSTQESEGGTVSNGTSEEDEAEEKEEKQDMKSKVATKLLKTFLQKYGVG